MPYANFENDREYLFGKFRNPVFDTTTGMDNTQVINAVDAYAESLGEIPVAVLKGKCFDFICRNMQIDVNPHDCYPGFACYDRIHRPMGNIIYARNIPRLNLKSLPEMDRLYKTGISSQWIDFDHSVPEWDNIMSLGFPGLKARARKYREQHEKNGTLTDKVAAYFDGIDITLQAVLDNIQRLIDFARERHTGNPRIEREIQCLEALLQGPPKDFYQALMINYLFFFYGEHIDHMQVRAMGNLDDMLYPYYLRDLASGRYTEEDMREFLACYLMQFGSINNYWGHPFYLGGTAEDGSSLYNPLSGIILDVFEELDITSPKIQLKIAKHTPDWILNKALGMVRKQNSALAFVGEENAINMLMQRYGATPEEARRHNITGCYEVATRNTNSTGSASVNMLKIVELVLNNGYSRAGDYQSACPAPKLSEIKSFEEFLDAYKCYVKFYFENGMKLADDYEGVLDQLNPGQLYSSTSDHSLEVGFDAFAGGTKYSNTGIAFSGLGTAVDALMALKLLVYDEKLLTLEELRDILNADWEGHEKLRLRMLYTAPKYGNGNPEVDKYAEMLTKFVSAIVNNRPNVRGGHYSLSGHSARQFIVQGALTGATPDGRKAGEEFSKNISPTMGADVNGVTAMINSVCTMNAMDMPGDFPLDVMMHPATVQGDEGLAAMRALLYTYFEKGGLQIQFNIFNADTLVEAQKHPERYANLQVRVCGWNVRFTELPAAEQNAYIERARRIIE